MDRSHRTVDVDLGSKRPGAGGVEEARHELVALGRAVCFDIVEPQMRAAARAEGALGEVRGTVARDLARDGDGRRFSREAQEEPARPALAHAAMAGADARIVPAYHRDRHGAAEAVAGEGGHRGTVVGRAVGAAVRRFHGLGRRRRLRALRAVAFAPLGAASRLGDLRGRNRLLAFALLPFEGHIDLRWGGYRGCGRDIRSCSGRIRKPL